MIVYTLRPATNADSSRRRSARRPNGASARSAVRHSSDGELVGAGDAAERDERRLARVLARRFARLGGIALDIEQIVDDLERQAEILREGRECCDRVAVGARHEGTRDSRRIEKRPRLAAVDSLQELEVDLLFGRQKVGSLARDESLFPQGIVEELSQANGERRLIASRQRAVREIEEAKGRQDRQRFTELHVIRRSASPYRRIVHGGKIVEDEGRGVDELHRRRGGQRPRRGAAAQFCGELRQHRTDALRRGEHAVRHRAVDRAALRHNELFQDFVDALLVGGKECRDVAHGCRGSRRGADWAPALAKTSMY